MPTHNSDIFVTFLVIVTIWLIEGFRNGIDNLEFLDKEKASERIQSIFSRNSSRSQIVKFSLGQKRCGHFGKCDYSGMILLRAVCDEVSSFLKCIAFGVYDSHGVSIMIDRLGTLLTFQRIRYG